MKDESQERTLWLTALQNLDTATPGEAKQIGPDTASSSADEISKSLTQQGAKSAKSSLDTLLELLALPNSGDPKIAARRRGIPLVVTDVMDHVRSPLPCFCNTLQTMPIGVDEL